MTIGIQHISAPVRTLVISGTPVTISNVNQVYPGFTVSAIGGNKPYTYSIQSGTLPTGLIINSSNGIISGTPTVISLATGIVIRVTDFAGRTADLPSFSINVSL